MIGLPPEQVMRDREARMEFTGFENPVSEVTSAVFDSSHKSAREPSIDAAPRKQGVLGTVLEAGCKKYIKINLKIQKVL